MELICKLNCFSASSAAYFIRKQSSCIILVDNTINQILYRRYNSCLATNILITIIKIKYILCKYKKKTFISIAAIPSQKTQTIFFHVSKVFLSVSSIMKYFVGYKVFLCLDDEFTKKVMDWMYHEIILRFWI